MTTERLKAALAGPGTYYGEAPYSVLYQEWLLGDEEFRFRLRQAMLDLLGEPLETPALNELCRLVEVCEVQEAVPILERLVHGGHPHSKLLVRTLLGLGWTGPVNLDFWETQKDLLGAGLVFKGLSVRDPELAFDALPELAPTEDAMRDVLGFLPWLAEQIGAEAVKNHARRIVSHLQPEAAALLQSWLNPIRTRILRNARPLTTDHERALYRAMHEESEAHWCAGWYSGCEYIFWNKGLFRDLARAAGGWIVWVDDQDLPGLPFGDAGPRVVSLEEWEILYKTGCPGCAGSGVVSMPGPSTVPCPFCTEP